MKPIQPDQTVLLECQSLLTEVRAELSEDIPSYVLRVCTQLTILQGFSELSRSAV